MIPLDLPPQPWPPKLWTPPALILPGETETLDRALARVGVPRSLRRAIEREVSRSLGARSKDILARAGRDADEASMPVLLALLATRRRGRAEIETFGTMGEASVGNNAALRTMYALQFTPTWGGTVTQAQIHDLSGGAQTWTAAVHLDSAGSPGAQVGAASNPENTVIDVINFDWATPPAVSANVTYWAVATRTSSGSRLATVNEVSGVVTGCGNSLGAISDGSDVDAGTDVRMGVTVTP